MLMLMLNQREMMMIAMIMMMMIMLMLMLTQREMAEEAAEEGKEARLSLLVTDLQVS